jgi:hypothetical protein
MRKNSFETALSVALLGSLLALSGCGGNSGGGGSAAAPLSNTSASSAVFAIDCARGHAYIPLNSPDINGNGQISVIDLDADPDVKDPRITTISLTHQDLAIGAAIDAEHSLVMVTSGQSGAGGFVDVIDEHTNTLVAGSPFAFPEGSQAGPYGAIVYNPTTRLAVLGLCENGKCSSGDPGTGEVTFNPVTHEFGAIIPANYPSAIALNSITNVTIDASDDDNKGEIGGMEVAAGRACTLADDNLGPSDGAGFDSATNIVVISAGSEFDAAVVNLNGSAFTAGTPCALNEGGAPPNSVKLGGFRFGIVGAAVDISDHRAFLAGSPFGGMALVNLPTIPVTQLTDQDVTSVSSSFPNDPFDRKWITSVKPAGVAVASCPQLPHKGFAINRDFTFVAEVDLATLMSTPDLISTPPPAGQCAGTSSVTKCNNGNGLTFFPLPLGK